jgi:multifunctional 2-oxoglutarate metabolism enzyme
LNFLESVFGPNSALVEELYNQYKKDPSSVPAHWSSYFAELEKEGGQAAPDVAIDVAKTNGHTDEAVVAPPPPATAKPAEVKPEPKPAAKAAEKTLPTGAQAEKIKGVAARIVDNMELSLDVPTATSLRVIPVKMMFEDRLIINEYQEKKGRTKTTFTHFISWAVVRALKEYPTLNSYFDVVDGSPTRISPGQVNLGIAIDLPGKDGKRNLVVPNIKGVDSMTFDQFVDAYSDLVQKARDGRLDVPDFEGTTISITNPGTLGTVSSAPRLMKGQGAIIATGSINYPAEFQAMSPEVLNHLGISKVMTVTCTYDHRIIQGAESGSFLAYVHSLLNGEKDFYEKIFSELDIPYEPIQYGTDKNSGVFGDTLSIEATKKAVSVMQLIQMYRINGHMLANLNPLSHGPGSSPELELSYFGLSVWDLDREFYCAGLGGREKAPLRDILHMLRTTYCGYIGAEFMHVQNLEERFWLRDRMEATNSKPELTREDKHQILHKLNQAEAFESFLHKKYVGHKRFSLEGAETVISMVDFMLEHGGDMGVEEVYLGMAHRGRLNVLVNTMGKSYQRIFNEFEGYLDPATRQGSGDVKYHLGTTGEHTTLNGKTIKLTLMPNPSHLEAVNPVVEGATRARQDELGEGADKKIVPLLLHGDAAFAGQGVVAETLNMSQLRGYKTGGTIHLIINNQIGFTTLPHDARSTLYASDLAKMITAPIFHINGDQPESAVHAMRLALEYRQKFNKDVVLDLICYRKYGHNEGDEPAFTQPGMYKEINGHPNVRDLYVAELLRKGELTREEADDIFSEFDQLLENAFDQAQQTKSAEVNEERIVRISTRQSDRNTHADTRYDLERIRTIALKLNTVPNDFDANPKLLRILAKRNEIVEKNEKKIEWGYAEAIAFGSLLDQGVNVRLSGQDVERGTFSHRHSVLHGTETNQQFVPLNHLFDKQGKYQVYNSHLSEFAVLGFEFGYSSVSTGTLVLWEAQFGDFSNGAQIIIDQFIAASEAKWGQTSSVVMLLPHGFEGQGPEHSSSRMERYLQLCAEDNMQVANCTTPAQYFHLLRRQAFTLNRKPLIVISPKSLLRHPLAVSSADELANGKFDLVIGDNVVQSENTKRVVFCSGKVYYDLFKFREEHKITDTALVRIEQIYPFPDADVREIAANYPNATDWVWCQEEPRNMGAWSFVNPLFEAELGLRLRYAGRMASASPAAGSMKVHNFEQDTLIRSALGQ